LVLTRNSHINKKEIIMFRSYKILLLSTLFSLVWFSAYSQGRDLQFGAHGGNLGWGVDLGYDVTQLLTVRLLTNRLGSNYNKTKAGISYKGDLMLQSFGLAFDWHLLGNGIRLTSAAYNNRNALSIGAKGELGLGDGHYSGNMDVEMDFNDLAPYLGVGWSSNRGSAGFGFGAEIGALFQGAPRLSASGKIGNCAFSVSKGGQAKVCNAQTGTTLAADLEKEHKELRKSLKNFTIYPVASVSIFYRF
jgi:hypothetical protein